MMAEDYEEIAKIIKAFFDTPFTEPNNESKEEIIEINHTREALLKCLCNDLADYFEKKAGYIDHQWECFNVEIEDCIKCRVTRKALKSDVCIEHKEKAIQLREHSESFDREKFLKDCGVG